jgi:cytochrome c553
MGRFLRTLMICMLVLALPVQGAIAASMMFCGMQLHSRVVLADAAKVAAQAAVSEPDCHGHASPDTQDSQDAKSPAQTCSVCATCHTLGALPGTVPTLPVAEPTSTVFSDIVAIIHPFATEGPDRPPRSIHV